MLWKTDGMESLTVKTVCVWKSNFTYSGWPQRVGLGPEDFSSERGLACPTRLMYLVMLHAALCGWCCSVTGDILSQYDRESVERTQVQSQQQLTQSQL